MCSDLKTLLFFTDFEFSVIVIAFIVLFAFSLKPKEGKVPVSFSPFYCLAHSKEMSVLVKGLACVMILVSHYSARVLGGGLPQGISYYVTIYSANLALIFFMFFSGFGISLANNIDYNNHFFSVWLTRVKKVYFPLLFVCSVHTLFFILPDSSISAGGKFLYAVGLADEWYVICIVYFYSIYFFSLFLCKLLHVNQSILLTLLMTAYYIGAFFYYGDPQAHFYRYPCAFLIGHLVAMKDRNPKLLSLLLLLVSLSTLIPLVIHYTKSYILAFIVLYVIGIIQQRTTVKNKSALYSLGIISYFFYLSHERIAWKIMELTSIHSCLLWIGITLVMAIVLYRCYSSLMKWLM